MATNNTPTQASLGVLWHAWEEMARELLRQERAAAHPYGLSRFEDCEGHLEDILTSVRQARQSAADMRASFPGYPPAASVTPA